MAAQGYHRPHGQSTAPRPSLLDTPTCEDTIVPGSVRKSAHDLNRLWRRSGRAHPGPQTRRRSMTGEELKQRTRAGGVVYGTMLSTARNPRWAATIAAFGLDYVIIDTEHSTSGQERRRQPSRGAGLERAPCPFVRIPIPDSHYVTMALRRRRTGNTGPLLRDRRAGQGGGRRGEVASAEGRPGHRGC